MAYRKPIATPSPLSRRLTLIGVPVLLVAILFLDSTYVRDQIQSEWMGQWAANILTFAYFMWMLRGASPRLRRLMIIGVGVATAGEVLFSLVIGMYEYRLENIPLYVPPGHTIVYAAIFQFIREPWVLRNAQRVTLALYGVGAAFSVYWLLFAHDNQGNPTNDVYGFICFGVFSALIFFNRDSRLFFVSMYLLVAYLELVGTHYQCWYWHPTLLNTWPIPSGNPPSGISVFYMGFDIGCLGFYMLSNMERRRRYDQYKAFRNSRRKALAAPVLSSEF